MQSRFAFRAIAKARASPMMICRHQGNGWQGCACRSNGPNFDGVQFSSTGRRPLMIRWGLHPVGDPYGCPDRQREPELPMPEVTKRNVDASRPKIDRMVGQVCRVTAIRAVGTVQSCSDRTRSRVNPGTPGHR